MSTVTIAQLTNCKACTHDWPINTDLYNVTTRPKDMYCNCYLLLSVFYYLYLYSSY